ncbi:hypothetical protein PUNSTDRAFT_55836 [Punctularia strigosozonata HHB-11173 SS5]|uniref:Uncharacterized protein n=1 Tax=Punctularia strigosozonata (strain HHB-11173) TaxID=741275 RepID=R7S426_PUNST|nr:uncharacterized protein PUNSTDRAFT_55836 [Punctularia strigosozonata HHB-11173 SS5]EIN03991.1 hypothetical protein PUNSTDRAFT_55836 [Punctularia strigosozonata HHB-11173 SS5]
MAFIFVDTGYLQSVGIQPAAVSHPRDGRINDYNAVPGLRCLQEELAGSMYIDSSHAGLGRSRFIHNRESRKHRFALHWR